MWKATYKAQRFGIDANESARDETGTLKSSYWSVEEFFQPVISEMRSYDRPPTIVQKVIEATFLLLGEPFQAINVRPNFVRKS